MGRKKKTVEPEGTPKTFALKTDGLVIIGQGLMDLRSGDGTPARVLSQQEFPLNLLELEPPSIVSGFGRIPIDGATQTITLGDPAKQKIGARLVTELKHHYQAAKRGNPKKLIAILKMYPIFKTRGDIRPALEKLAEKQPKLARSLRGDDKRGRPFAPSPIYARVEELKADDPSLSQEAAIKRAFVEMTGQPESEYRDWDDPFRRAYFDQKKFCEPFEVAGWINLDE